MSARTVESTRNPGYRALRFIGSAERRIEKPACISPELARQCARSVTPAGSSDMALRHGCFGMDEYVEHLMGFLGAISPGAHLIAVCQPCVPALAAAALMAEDDDPAAPRSLTLMAGPIDARINPTQVNMLACGRPLEWFERNVIMPVPLRHRGRMRLVYPGFLQLAAFMNMNRGRHVGALRGLYRDLADGNDERAAKTKAFYDEYFSVLDLPAEFYLETVRAIFKSTTSPAACCAGGAGRSTRGRSAPRC
jgi:poly(3-hydroxybutyrate) depolymerase